MYRLIFLFVMRAVLAARQPLNLVSPLPTPEPMERATTYTTVAPITHTTTLRHRIPPPYAPTTTTAAPITHTTTLRLRTPPPYAPTTTTAAPILHTLPPVSNIIRQTNDINLDGSYQWSYEAINGNAAEEKGKLLNSPEGPIEATGSFRYTSLDGNPISLTYVANKNGFQPIGDHLPFAPPIPPLIARALEWIAAHPEPINKN